MHISLILKHIFLRESRHIKNKMLHTIGVIGTILIALLFLFLIPICFYLGSTIFASQKYIELSRVFVFNHFFSYLLIIFVIKFFFIDFFVDKKLLFLPVRKSTIIHISLVKTLFPSILGIFSISIVIFIYYFLITENFFHNIIVLFSMLLLLLVIHLVTIVTRVFSNNIIVTILLIISVLY